MYYAYVTSGSSLLIESTDSMITDSKKAVASEKYFDEQHLTGVPHMLAKIAICNCTMAIGDCGVTQIAKLANILICLFIATALQRGYI